MTQLPETRETILVVEDAEAIRKMVCTLLAQSGYDCLEAADGREALTLIENGSPLHLMLTDVVMPHMSGGELARHVARLRPDLRIIFMSGYSDDPIVRSIESLPRLFLPKPFTANALTERIRSVLDDPWAGLPAPAAMTSE